MPDRRYTILSTATLPFERIDHIPDFVDVRVIPFIKIIPIPGVELMPVISEMSGEKKSVIFTSAHAVKFVSELLKQKPDWKIYCLRNETRNAVSEFFGNGAEVRFAEDASSLSGYLINDKVKEAVFFCGDQRLGVLPDKLKKHGIGLAELVVYETRLTPVRLPDTADAVLFFSPTAVRSFFSENELDSGTAVFAMGKTTAAELEKFTNNNIIVSPQADKAFVVNMAIEYAASHPIPRI
jgi:uroporphyrinogen-III synthase